jgi:peptide/nickel transport system permease protein
VRSTTDSAIAQAVPAPRRRARRGFGPFYWICVGWLGVLALVTVFAGVLPLEDPTEIAANALPNASPSASHLLGTDDLGRDILSRVIHGAQVSLEIGIGATAIGIGIGGVLGMLAAYKRGRLDGWLSLLMYTGLAFPAIIAVIAILNFWGHAEAHLVVVLGLFSVPLIFRLVRAATLSSATKEYVTAARSQGATSARVLARDIFPNVAPTILTYTIFTLGGIIATEGALAFIGLSVLPPESSWGNMIAESSSVQPVNLWLMLVPTLALFFTLVALNYVGERLRQHFDGTEARS